mgnify:CR=1 FL=1
MKQRKWRIYPRGAAFWVTLMIISIIVGIFMATIAVANWEENFLLSIIAVSIIMIGIVVMLILFFLSNVSIDQDDRLNMPFFCRNLMPFFNEKKKKIVLQKNLIDVHLKSVGFYVYLGFEDDSGKIEMINVTMFSRKQCDRLKSKLEEYKR